MKKTYLRPEVDFQLMDTEEMMAESVGSVEGFNNQLSDETIGVDDMLSRRSNVWEDED